MKKYQPGFSAVEIVMVVFIIGLIGTVGWLFWQNISKNPADNNSATATNKTKDEIKKDSAATSTNSGIVTTPTAKYLTIKEWGIKLPLDSSIADLSYSDYNEWTDAAHGITSSTVMLNINKGKCSVGDLTRTPDKAMNDSGWAAAEAQAQAASTYNVIKHFGGSGGYMYTFATGAIGEGVGGRPACATDAIVDKIGGSVGGLSKQ